MAGCTGIQILEEKQARGDAGAVGDIFRPNGERPKLPELNPESDVGEYLRFALLNNQQVEAAYYDWLASVEKITLERSLPDPRLTFEMYIQSVVTSVMPGLTMDFPAPGKLRARGQSAAAESERRYFVFQTQALQTAFTAKKSLLQLHFLEERIRVSRRTQQLLAHLEELARAQNSVGKVTLQDVLRAQIEQDRLTTEIANLEDSRGTMMAQFKSALGLRVSETNPPLPEELEQTNLDLSSDELLAAAISRNPRIKAMEAEVRRAGAELSLAYKARRPDFSAGFETDVKAAPVIVNPQLSVTLPIWRDKIAAQIAEAQAGKRAAEARLTSEQIALAVEFAEKSFLYREATRRLKLLRDQLLAKARQSFDVARIAYLSGQLDFFNLSDAERTLLGFELDEVAAREQRELALAELSLLILAQSPEGMPAARSASARFERKK